MADLSERLQFVDRLRQLAGACLHLFEQPRILDGNDGLVGERGHQLDLLVGKWFHLGTADRECADGLVFPKQRDG